MSSTTLHSATERAAVFTQLARRHTLVRALRIAVPLVGIGVLAALVVQVYLGTLPGGVNIGGVRLDRDRLVVDRPTMTGALSDGGRYEVVAQTASTALADTSRIELTALDGILEFSGGTSARAHAASGMLDFSARELRTGEVIELETSDGISGRLTGGAFDMPHQVFSTGGGVRFAFPGGSTLAADSMAYDAPRGVWRFKGVTVRVMPGSIAVSPGPGQ
jgi:lipopolysaccharide export system protein LptC